MTSPAEREYALSVIARYSRNGCVQWQNVAAVLGRCAADVKREYDLAIPPMPEPPANEPGEPAKSEIPPLRAKVLCYLAKGSAQPEIIANSTGMRPEAVRARLSELQCEGLVKHDGAWGRATSRTWSLTALGTQQTLAVCPIVQNLPRTSARSPSGARRQA